MMDPNTSRSSTWTSGRGRFREGFSRHRCATPSSRIYHSMRTTLHSNSSIPTRRDGIPKPQTYRRVEIFSRVISAPRLHPNPDRRLRIRFRRGKHDPVRLLRTVWKEHIHAHHRCRATVGSPSCSFHALDLDDSILETVPKPRVQFRDLQDIDATGWCGLASFSPRKGSCAPHGIDS